MHITTGPASLRAKPTDDQIDIYALTHQGKLRTQNLVVLPTLELARPPGTRLRVAAHCTSATGG